MRFKPTKLRGLVIGRGNINKKVTTRNPGKNKLNEFG